MTSRPGGFAAPGPGPGDKTRAPGERWPVQPAGQQRCGAREQVEAGRRIADHAFRDIVEAGQELPFLPGDDGRVSHPVDLSDLQGGKTFVTT